MVLVKCFDSPIVRNADKQWDSTVGRTNFVDYVAVGYGRPCWNDFDRFVGRYIRKEEDIVGSSIAAIGEINFEFCLS